jgi:hypothetical protein
VPVAGDWDDPRAAAALSSEKGQLSLGPMAAWDGAMVQSASVVGGYPYYFDFLGPAEATPLPRRSSETPHAQKWLLPRDSRLLGEDTARVKDRAIASFRLWEDLAFPSDALRWNPTSVVIAQSRTS